MRKLTLLYRKLGEAPLKSLNNSDMIYISFHHDNTVGLNIDPLYKFNKFKELLDLCKKHDGENIDTTFLRNFPFLRIYIRNILKILLDPLLLTGVVHENRILLIDDLDRVYDNNTCEILNIGSELSDYIKDEFNMEMDIRIIVKEKPRGIK